MAAAIVVAAFFARLAASPPSESLRLPHSHGNVRMNSHFPSHCLFLHSQCPVPVGFFFPTERWLGCLLQSSPILALKIEQHCPLQFPAASLHVWTGIF